MDHLVEPWIKKGEVREVPNIFYHLKYGCSYSAMLQSPYSVIKFSRLEKSQRNVYTISKHVRVNNMKTNNRIKYQNILWFLRLTNQNLLYT